MTQQSPSVRAPLGRTHRVRVWFSVLEVTVICCDVLTEPLGDTQIWVLVAAEGALTFNVTPCAGAPADQMRVEGVICHTSTP